MTKSQMEITVGQTNSGWFYFEIIDGERLVARVVNFDSAARARAAANEYLIKAEIEALTGKPVSVVRHIGRLSISHIASYIDDAGWEIGNHQDTEEAALNGLLAEVRATLPEAQTKAA